jgi:adenylate cyclase
MASRLAFSPDIRLGCQTSVTGDVKVRRLVLDDEDVELTNLLVKGAEPGLVGVEKHVLVLFADIRGFTPFSEALLPYDVIHVLNRYFNIMGHVISSHGGRIDNYMGDGLMAIFEADDPVEGTLGAVRAGLGMLEALQEHMHPYLERIWGKRFQIGVGLHYGLVGVGTVGALGDRRKKVIGDAVNLASRIESANKKAGTQFLVSEDAYALVAEHVKINRTMKVKIRGKTGKYRLYEVVGLTDEALRIGATEDDT